MKPIVIGSSEDVAGFAFAGVDGVVCTTGEEVDRALAMVTDDMLVLFSSDAAALAGFAIGRWKRSGAGPSFVVLSHATDH